MFPSRVFPLNVPEGTFWRDDPANYSDVLESLIQRHGIDYLYKIEDGSEVDLTLSSVPTLVHAVFECKSPHGDRMLAISHTVENIGNGCFANVPFMVWMADCGSEDLRSKLGIPTEAFVYGWVGGDGSWDPSVTAIVREVAVALGAKVFFMFQNFPHDQAAFLKDMFNVVMVEPTNDAYFKCQFGQTMDVFLHTRLNGETFGLAVAEVRSLWQAKIAFLIMLPQIYLCLCAGESASTPYIDVGNIARPSSRRNSPT